MTEKDLEEFEKEFGFKLLPTSFKKPLSEITKEEYIDVLDQMEELYYNSDNCTLAMNLFKEDINLLTGLVNECFEENAETNYEHFNEYCILLDFEGNIRNKTINRCVFLLELKKYGLFRNVPDNVSINEILANCEVIR